METELHSGWAQGTQWWRRSGQPQQDQEVKIRAVRRRGRPDGGRGSDPSLGRPASCLAASDLVLSPGCWAGLVLTCLSPSRAGKPFLPASLLPWPAEGVCEACGPLWGSRPASRRAPGSGSAERGRESPGRMSAQGAGHSTGGGCDEAAALGPAELLATEEGERPGALRQMWRYRSWDVPQIPAEVPQSQ